ncbi:MAG: glycosyltransferase, partial [Rhizobiales bacterium]|nr:glycosyltransferase [Hyphomicrobiales bacterium]
MAKLTVIIPFYQKEPGILRRALTSVFAQGFNDFDVIVVDDESPWPPDGDLIDFSEDEQARVRVI